ncbi:pentapeptide repeat-containing protein [Umezawaea endophytica]|uniref:Pentapeptide repeat-containing protein n=1 Tax=Umezawaea endophytica TaxID=1654476 RepID=A0A9X3A466_9PSEU|nr:pentapeptide repeat-containing protein [Umezawaea endophytica]MCS7480883.1 pentapeptide repeat-containing protein [Umezawaea endophytica]
MRGRLMLLASVLAAVAVTAATVVVLLLVEPKLSKAEAVKTGGLAGGAVVALYALWLNDRRRRTEEARHELESEKVADERFARSVEMLGHDADQVRVGAMHALAGLTASSPRYKQTVLDVLCAYLRRPFHHRSYSNHSGDPDKEPRTPNDEELARDDREREVRRTAQRLITDMLPWGADEDPVAYHLDLTGASLEYFRLSGRRIGRLTARRANFYGITMVNEVEASKPALFSGAVFHGRASANSARFGGGLSLQDTTFHDEFDVRGAVVDTFLHLSTDLPKPVRGELTVEPGTGMRIAPPEGWRLAGAYQVEQRPGGRADGRTGDDHGLGDRTSVQADEPDQLRLERERLRHERDAESEPDEVQQ